MAMLDTRAVDYLGDNVPRQPFNEWEFLIAGAIFFYHIMMAAQCFQYMGDNDVICQFWHLEVKRGLQRQGTVAMFYSVINVFQYI